MADIYVKQTSSGLDTGTDEANAHSVTWLNNASNWGVGLGKVQAGDTVRLCGTITQFVHLQGNGSEGNPITIYFEPNAKISTANTTLIYAPNREWIVIDGGLNGVCENTANGTLLANKTVVKGIWADGVSNFSVRNLTIRDIYVHPDSADGLADSSLNFAAGGGVYSNGYGVGIVIENCVFSDICWCINVYGTDGATLRVDGCSFENYDHGIGGVAPASGTLASFVAVKNTFGSTKNWDTTANVYHHDGIHTFWGDTSGGIAAATIAYNTFEGEWGVNNTAHLYLEQNYNTHDPAEAPNWKVYNNLFKQSAGNLLNNGFAVLIGDGMLVANNTFVGSGVANSVGVTITGSGVLFKNNLVTGAHRFVSLTAGSFIAGGLNNNRYSNQASGGTSAFSNVGVACTGLVNWQDSTEQDELSLYSDTPWCDSDGFPSTAGGGADLSSTFTDDLSEHARFLPWDIGAIQGNWPPGPTDLSAPASALSLSWTDASSDEDGFTIERSLNGSTGWTEIAVLPAGSTAYVDVSLANNTTYYYRVAAYNEYGTSSYSNIASATTGNHLQ